jgi:hypothetical protein
MPCSMVSSDDVALGLVIAVQNGFAVWGSLARSSGIWLRWSLVWYWFAGPLTFAHRANEADLVSAASADWHLAGASRVARVDAGWQGGEPCSYPVMGQARGAFTLPGGCRWPSGLPRRMRETGSCPRLAVQERQPRRVLYQGMPRAPGGAHHVHHLPRRHGCGCRGGEARDGVPGMRRVCGRPGRPDYAVLVSGTEPADGQGR